MLKDADEKLLRARKEELLAEKEVIEAKLAYKRFKADRQESMVTFLLDQQLLLSNHYLFSEILVILLFSYFSFCKALFDGQLCSII